MLAEQELSLWRENAVNFPKRGCSVRDSTHRVRDKNGVETCIRKWNLFGGQTNQFHLKPGLINALSCQRMHLERWIQSCDVDDSGLVLVAHVQPGTNTDL